VICTTKVLPTNANYGHEDFTWSVNNANGAFDVGFHKFTAVSAGEVTLTATSDDIEGLSGSVTFVISEKVTATSIAITGAPSGNKIKVGQTVQLGYELTPAGVSSYNITWSSSASSKVSVTSAGLIEGKAVGEAVITVRDTVSGKTDSVTITVEAASGTAILPSSLQGTFYAEYGECLEIDGGTLTLTDLCAGQAICEFTGQYGNKYNGSRPSYRFANADESVILDVTIFNDTIEVYIIEDSNELLYCFDDYFSFSM
ncbi:MAG: Ig-like domain-containing protein, partial [Bacilli bacterium]|nr:Ig-like domain-containing protein [Bacilli bacterium]